MRAVLKASGISKEEAAANSDAVLDVLAFHLEGGPPPKQQGGAMRSHASLTKDIEAAVNIKNEDYRQKFSALKQLGQGASGTVYSAINREGKKVALKVAPISELKFLINEIGLQSLSAHPNIVQYTEAYSTKTEICIVMELVDGGSLTDCIGEVPFPESHIAYVCQQTLLGLAFMHEDYRLHRDIKSDNILVISSYIK
jgi:serine/threonine protein kinase